MSHRTHDSDGLGETAARAATLVMGHGVAVGIIYLLVLVVLMGTDRLFMVGEVLTDPGFVGAALPSFLIHLAVAAGIWIVICGIWLRFQKQSNTPRRIKVSRGTVMLETIVVLPVMITLILGMAQLAINTTTGILGHLAVYESARTVWLWHPERDRHNLDTSDIEEKARLQAAAVLTPVAFSYAPVNTQVNADQEAEDRFLRFRGALVGGQLDLSEDAGQRGEAIADFIMDTAQDTYGDQDMGASGLISGLDGTDFAARTALKFTGAYMTTEAFVEEGDDGTSIICGPTGCHPVSDGPGEGEIGVNLRYHHYQSIPFVGILFADDNERSEGGTHPRPRPGFYATYDLTYTITEQPTPHPETP